MTSAGDVTHALVRAPGPAFVNALGQTAGVSIDLTLARAQHAAYVAALRALGLEIAALPTLFDFADACFVEDTAVIYGDAALVTRPGAESRRGEEASVAWALGNLGLTLMRMLPPATLDGGDVMRVGDTFHVGRSARSNKDGIETLRAFASRVGAKVVIVDLPPEVLHLKCHASPLGEHTVLAVEGLQLELASGVRRLDVPRDEAYAANAVAVGNGVLIAADHPKTAAVVSAAGYTAHLLATSEVAKAAGSLTCLSLLC